MRRKIEERERAAAAAEAAGPLTATQIARLQYTAAQLLQPGESVAAGLKRLGGRSRRPAKRSKRGEGAADMDAEAAPDPEAKEHFNRLTEAAMQLMDAGENDVYTQTRVGCGWVLLGSLGRAAGGAEGSGAPRPAPPRAACSASHPPVPRCLLPHAHAGIL